MSSDGGLDVRTRRRRGRDVRLERRGDDVGDETGNPPSDTLFTIDPTGSLRYLGRRSSFDANYRGNIRRYTTSASLDGYDQQAGMSFDRRATKRLTVYAQNRSATSPTTDQVDSPGCRSACGVKSDTLGAGLTSGSRAYRFDRPVRFQLGTFDRQAPDLPAGPPINPERLIAAADESPEEWGGGKLSLR